MVSKGRARGYTDFYKNAREEEEENKKKIQPVRGGIPSAASGKVTVAKDKVQRARADALRRRLGKRAG